MGPLVDLVYALVVVVAGGFSLAVVGAVLITLGYCAYGIGGWVLPSALLAAKRNWESGDMPLRQLIAETKFDPTQRALAAPKATTPEFVDEEPVYANGKHSS